MSRREDAQDEGENGGSGTIPGTGALFTLLVFIIILCLLTGV